MKYQTFGAFFLAFALPSLAANLEQPAAETTADNADTAAIQQQSQDLQRRIAPFVLPLASILGPLVADRLMKGKGKRSLDEADQADTDAAIAELADMISSGSGDVAEQDDAHLQRRFLPLLWLLKNKGKRSLDEADIVSTGGSDVAEQDDAQLQRRFLPLLWLLKNKGKRSLDGTEADYAELADMISAGSGDVAEQDDSHLQRRFLPLLWLLKNKGKRSLDGADQADTEAALAELADMITAAGGEDAALQRRFVSTPVPSGRWWLGPGRTHHNWLLPAKPGAPKAARSLDGGADQAELERRVAPLVLPLVSILGPLVADRLMKGKGKRSLDGADEADALAQLNDLAAMQGGGAEVDAHLQRRLAPLIPILGGLFGSLFASKAGRRKRSVEDDAALAQLADMIAAADAPPALGRRDDATTSSHLSSADLADVLGPIQEEVAQAGEEAAAEAAEQAQAQSEQEKRDEAVSRMRVARGIME